MIAVLAIALLATLFGAILGFASIRFKVEADPIVDQIDAILPQTQCGQCGYPGCRPYAEAIANGDSINKCPPGGQATIEKLADLMGVEAEESAHDLEGKVKKSRVYPRRHVYWLHQVHPSLSGRCYCWWNQSPTYGH